MSEAQSPPSAHSPIRSTLKSPSQLKALYIKRIMREIEYFKTRPPLYLVDFAVDSGDIRKWNIAIKPRCHPYSYGIFKIKIDLPNEYPFKPPQMQFLTPIYHPNFDENGLFCLSILEIDNWKACTTVAIALDSLLHLLERPQPERSLRLEIGDQYYYQRDAFIETAAAKTKKDAVAAGAK